MSTTDTTDRSARLVEEPDQEETADLAESFLQETIWGDVRICNNCVRRRDRREYFRTVGGCRKEQLADRFCDCGAGDGADHAWPTAEDLPPRTHTQGAGTLAREWEDGQLPIRGSSPATDRTLVELVGQLRDRLAERGYAVPSTDAFRELAVRLKVKHPRQDEAILAATAWAHLPAETKRQYRQAIDAE